MSHITDKASKKYSCIEERPEHIFHNVSTINSPKCKKLESIEVQTSRFFIHRRELEIGHPLTIKSKLSSID